MKDLNNLVEKMEKEPCILRMVDAMMVHGKMTICMGMVFCFIVQVNSPMKENGLKTNSMGKVESTTINLKNIYNLLIILILQG